MRMTYLPYDKELSEERINKILSMKEENVTTIDKINDDDLGLDNSFNVSGISLCVYQKNIRLSIERPRINELKQYKCFLSEVTAILRSHKDCQEIDQHDNHIMSVYLNANIENVQSVFNVAAKTHSVVALINQKLRAQNIEPMKVGIGLAIGQYTIIGNIHDGSPSPEIHWIGLPKKEAYDLGRFSNSTFYDEPIMVTVPFFMMLPQRMQQFFNYNTTRGCYQCNVVSPL